MHHPRIAGDDTCRIGEEVYERTIRFQVESAEIVGKLVSIDIETGAYALGSDDNLDAPHSLLARHQGAAIYTNRIGYNAVYTLGGVLERTTLGSWEV